MYHYNFPTSPGEDRNQSMIEIEQKLNLLTVGQSHNGGTQGVSHK